MIFKQSMYETLFHCLKITYYNSKMLWNAFMRHFLNTKMVAKSYKLGLFRAQKATNLHDGQTCKKFFIL